MTFCHLSILLAKYLHFWVMSYLGDKMPHRTTKWSNLQSQTEKKKKRHCNDGTSLVTPPIIKDNQLKKLIKISQDAY